MAKGAEGAQHAITIEDQGSVPLRLRPLCRPGDRGRAGRQWSRVETHDAFEGTITEEADKPSALLNFPFLNPQTGPISVKGAEKGDALAVRIISIMPRGPQPVGTTCLLPEFGGLVAHAATPRC